MFESVIRDSEQKQDNLGYILGWLCGGTLILGVIVSAVDLFQGHRRKAFQAIILPVIVLAWVFGIMFVIAIAELITKGRYETWVQLLMVPLFGGIIFVPLLGLRFLRDLAWPARVGRQGIALHNINPPTGIAGFNPGGQP
jgi:hypothetical protein